MFGYKQLTIKRVLPNNKHGGIIAFKGTKPIGPKEIDVFIDPYYQEYTYSSDDSISLFSDSTLSSTKFKQYDPSKAINVAEDLSVRNTYSIRELKMLLSAYIGAPPAHIDIRAYAAGKSLGHIIGVDNSVVCIDALRRVNMLPDSIELYLWGDWKDDSQLLVRWPEISDPSSSILPISIQLRTRVLNVFMGLEETIESLWKVPIQKGILGSFISTEYETIHEGTYGLNTRRLFELLHLDDEILGIYYHAGDKIVCKVPSNDQSFHKQMLPYIPGDIIIQQLLQGCSLPKEYKYLAPKSFIITIRDNCAIMAFTGWTGARGISPEDTKRLTNIAISNIINRIKQLNINNYTFPDNNVKFTSKDRVLNGKRMQYYELFKGGDFRKVRDIIAKLGKNHFVNQIFTGEVKVSFILPGFDSAERITRWLNYAHSRTLNSNTQQIWNSLEFGSYSLSSFLSGPVVSFVYDSKHKTLNGELNETTNELEAIVAREIIRRIAGYSGFKSIPRNEMALISRLSLQLLMFTDPALFSPRELSSGIKQNYSRICQGSERHPIPVTSDIAAKKVQDRVIRLKNFTYGGQQIYYCQDNRFPYPSIRFVSDDWWVPCCIKTKISSESLKAREFYTGARHLLFSLDDIKDFVAGIVNSPYPSPLLFNGQIIPEGRLATLPSDIGRQVPYKHYIYSPTGINTSDLSEVVSYISGESIELKAKTLTEQMGELLVQHISVLIITLVPAGGKRWIAELALPKNPSYIIDENTFVLYTYGNHYYPLVDKHVNIAKCPKIYVDAQSSKSGVDRNIFTYRNIKKQFEITKQVVYSYRTYAVIIKFGDKELAIPIVPIVEQPNISVISTMDMIKYLPTSKEIAKIFSSLNIPRVSIEKRLITDNGNVIGFKLTNEPILFIIVPGKLDFIIDDDSNDVRINGRLMYRLLNPFIPTDITFDSSVQIDLLIDVCVVSLADCIIRTGDKKWLSLLDNKDALTKYFIDQLKRCVIIGEPKISLIEGNLVDMSAKMIISKKIAEKAAYKLAMMIPDIKNLAYIYVVTIDTILDRNKYGSRNGEKILISQVD
jgi:hypothetical protein